MNYVHQTLKIILASMLVFAAGNGLAGELKSPKAMKKLGSLAPAFKLRSLDGALVRLDEIAYPGKEKRWAKKQNVLLDFFRTDCSPCLRSMPELVSLHEAYKEKGVKVILIALLEEDKGREKLEKYLALNKLPFTIVVDSNEHFSKQYLGKTIALPSSFLISKDGKIIKEKRGAKGSMADYFKGSIEELISANSPQ